MGSTFAGERPNLPERRVRNPGVDAPLRVVGFDLSARAEKSGLAADYSDKNIKDVSAECHSDCKNPCWIRLNTLRNSNPGVSSPRSALQQLLLPDIAIADPPSLLSANHGNRLSCEPASSSRINNRKQAGLLTLTDRSKKSSFFILPATSLIAETSQRCSHQQGADHQCKFNSRVVNMEFSDACHLCKRCLGQGRDVFMYSGDKAFCSTECREHQIVTDERTERCTPRIIRAGAPATFRSFMARNTNNARIKQTRETSSIKPISINKHSLMNHATAA